MPRRVDDGVRKRCQCERRKWIKCKHPWHFGFHHGGRQYRFSLEVIARARGDSPPASKVEAVRWRDKLRTEIASGRFVDPTTPVPAAAGGTLTFADVADRYLHAYVGKIVDTDGRIRWSCRHLRLKTSRQAEYHVKMLNRIEIPAANGTKIRLGSKPIDAITKADVEAVRDARRPHGVIGCNRLLARFRHFFNWAIAEGFIEHTPFKRGGVSVVKLETRAERSGNVAWCQEKRPPYSPTPARTCER